VVVTLYHGAEEGWPVVAKRAIDVSISASALVVLAPFLLGIGLLVRLTSPGPALFSQERIGINKRRFRMRKFRTMAVDAEQSQAALEHLNEVEGAAFKIEKDPRVTRFGHFLRTTSLDELPQLWNVLVGEMSLVGPRPLPLRDFRLFDQDRHRRRFSVRPGVTGLSQVSGRSSISFEDWMQLDLQYIDGWSLAADLRILVKTVPAVLKRVGAK
jgi:lipopolysaccharide/colanic/teichoic acid biosynthesis glycosyltransferase